MFPTVSTAAPHVRSKRLRAIAATSEQPAAALPGGPLIMSVYANFRAASWVGLLAPAKLAPDNLSERRVGTPFVPTRTFGGALHLAHLSSSASRLSMQLQPQRPNNFKNSVEAWAALA